MNKRTLRVLEYNKILDMLASYAVSMGAKRMCLKLKPLTNRPEIEALQQNTRDAYLRLEKQGSCSFSGIRDIRGSLKLLEIKSALSQEELLDIASLLETADSVRSYGASDKSSDEIENSRDSLSGMFEDLIPLRDISSEIRRCILSATDIADDASSALKAIRHKKADLNQRLHSLLDKIVKSESNKGLLMDSLVTMRNGRYCIPVKVEHRNAFPGMIHDRSSTGSTFFIEPMEAVNMNNEIQELESDERVEIEKILANLSLMAGSAATDIAEDLKLLTELDFIFAKARFAKAYRASEPIFNDKGVINLKRAIHPLLDQKTAVPVDIRLGEDYKLLIITGPNTGGKTVSLKTLGLLTLMAQSGLHIPTAEGSTMKIFDNVFADIGDEQSIEQNLSTFSSHMSNIVYIVDHADDKSLCLFDEPGGGTDPAEGAALAIGILTFLKNMGAYVMATTHYTELKTYAIGTDGVENASCEFDMATLRPTYKLMIGIPGSSNAFAIAKRLGLDESIISGARDRIDSESLRMEQIIHTLESSQREIEQDKERIAAYTAEIESLKKSLSSKEENLTQKKEDILRRAREDAQKILDDAKETADQAIRDINKWKQNPAAADMSSMEKHRTNIREKRDALNKSRPQKKRSSNQKPEDFAPGDSVYVISFDSEGTVLAKADSKGRISVQIGAIQSRVPSTDLIWQEKKPEKEEKTFVNSSSRGISKAANFRPELNVLGQTVDEAVSNIDKFLDDALLSHCTTVTIIHGKGTGALRRGIHEYLKKHPAVSSFRAGEFGEGDAGVTIVEF